MNTYPADETPIAYPYMPEGRTIEYVSADDAYMEAARTVAREQSLDSTMPTGSVIVRDGAVIGRGANGSNYHETHGCERVRLGIPTGQGYELCEGCSPENHSEPRAIANATDSGQETRDADLYLWGHWWACESCWGHIAKAGIRQVYLMKNSQVLFNKEHPDNIIGRQFA